MANAHQRQLCTVARCAEACSLRRRRRRARANAGTSSFHCRQARETGSKCENVTRREVCDLRPFREAQATWLGCLVQITPRCQNTRMPSHSAFLASVPVGEHQCLCFADKPRQRAEWHGCSRCKRALPCLTLLASAAEHLHMVQRRKAPWYHVPHALSHRLVVCSNQNF